MWMYWNNDAMALINAIGQELATSAADAAG